MSKMDVKSLRTPRERVWSAILKIGKAGGTFTVFDVQDACAPMVLFSTVSACVRGFARGGYLEEVQPTKVLSQHGARHSSVLYRMVIVQFDTPRIDADGKSTIQGLGILAMWRSMRVLPSFDFRDIARAATLEPLTVSQTTARLYVNSLFHAGYLKQLREPTRQKPGLYKLVRNTGPNAPAITRRKVVFDRNNGTFSNLETAQEVCDGLE